MKEAVKTPDIVVGKKTENGKIVGYTVLENGVRTYYEAATLLARVRDGRQTLANMKLVAGQLAYC